MLAMGAAVRAPTAARQHTFRAAGNNTAARRPGLVMPKRSKRASQSFHALFSSPMEKRETVSSGGRTFSAARGVRMAAASSVATLEPQTAVLSEGLEDDCLEEGTVMKRRAKSPVVVEERRNGIRYCVASELDTSGATVYSFSEEQPIDFARPDATIDGIGVYYLNRDDAVVVSNAPRTSAAEMLMESASSAATGVATKAAGVAVAAVTAVGIAAVSWGSFSDSASAFINSM